MQQNPSQVNHDDCQFVTLSDDCEMIAWYKNKPQYKLPVETLTCGALVGKPGRQVLVGGSHSGNILVVRWKTTEIRTVDSAH